MLLESRYQHSSSFRNKVALSQSSPKLIWGSFFNSTKQYSVGIHDTQKAKSLSYFVINTPLFCLFLSIFKVKPLEQNYYLSKNRYDYEKTDFGTWPITNSHNYLRSGEAQKSLSSHDAKGQNHKCRLERKHLGRCV